MENTEFLAARLADLKMPGALEAFGTAVLAGVGVGKTHLAIRLATAEGRERTEDLLRLPDRPSRLPGGGQGRRPARPPPQDR